MIGSSSVHKVSFVEVYCNLENAPISPAYNSSTSIKSLPFTIYNLDGFSVKIKLYDNSTLIGTETYNYDLGVKNGDSYAGYFNFYANGKIDSIEYVSWSANYSSFWETYKIWFIVSIVLVSIAFIIYIIFMNFIDVAFF